MIKKILIASSAVAIIASASSFSAIAAEDYSSFKKIDADANGFISVDEAKIRKDLKDNWKSIDKDKNGQLDLAEFSAFEAAGMTPSKDTVKSK